MCIRDRYQEGATDAPVITLLTDGMWNNYCREDDNYEQHELEALNAQLSGTDIRNDAQIQNILDQLGQVTLRFNQTQGSDYLRNEQGDIELLPDGGATVRKHANEAVNNALGFIFTTPFIFAEGQ